MEPGDNLTREEAESRAALVSDARYDVSLDVTGEDGTFGCEAVVRFACREPGSSTFLDFVAPTVERVELNGTTLPAGAFDGVRIHLDDLAATNEVRVHATVPYGKSGVGLYRFRDPVDDRVYVHTDLEPFDAHRVFPCFDQPDVKAVFEFSVHAPEGWEVVSNSAPAGQPLARVDGAVSWRFTPTPRISTYIAVVVAGPYHVAHDRHGTVELGLYCRQSLARYLDSDEIFQITKQGLDFYQEVFDYAYPFGKYDQVFVPEFNSGAMENAGCVTFNESYLFRSKVTDAARERRAGTILHEMAHMWFGDLVTMRWWDDLWLNESFADFAAVLAQARATRFTNTWITFANSEKLWAYQQDQLPSTHPIVADVPDTRSIHVNFDGITYAKGAAVLRQLVAWVGEEPFLDGVRRYFRRHEFGNTDLGDFLVALEETSGRDLRAWSKEWLETAGLNTLRPAFETTTRNGKDVFSSFIIAQEAPAEWPVLRPHRVTVGLYVASNRWLERRRGVEIDVVGGGTQVDDLVGEPVPDLVLVNDEDLAYAKIRLDPRSLRTLTQRLRDLRDPLPRAIAWAACWDMVRDAEMPTREYLPVVLGHVGAEEDIGVVQRQLSQLRRAIDLYGDPANREAARQSLAEAAHRQMFEAAPGSDHQLAWARTFIAAAGSEEHVSLVRGLLDGTTQFEGLEVDTDLRWHIVVCLAAGGAADEDVIVAELERDPTDAGRRHAATARAARPTPEAKALAWDAVIGDVSLPPATVNAIIRGFQQAGQPTLLEPYAPKYFSAVKPTWATRDLEMALAFTAGVYPRLVIGQEVVDMTDDYLATESPPRPARRLILEGRDDVLRSMRARARDAERE